MHAPISRKLVIRCRRAHGSIPLFSTLDAGEGRIHNLPQSFPTLETRYGLQDGPEAPAMWGPSPPLVNSSEKLGEKDTLVKWEEFRKRYEVRYLGAFDPAFVHSLIRSAPFLVARLACTLAPSNPKHVAKLLDVFGEVNFPIEHYLGRAERKAIARMLTHPSLGPSGSAWLFNEVQKQLVDWECNSCGVLNAASATKCKHCSNCSHMWQCVGCGLYNRGSSVACEGCGGGDKRQQIQAFRWRCESCSFINPTSHLVCTRCSSAMPLPASPKVCPTCRSSSVFRSCFPWCEVCGAAENKGAVSLWMCSWCSTENNSLTPFCEGCGEERTGQGHKAWYQWRCTECATPNPYWGKICRTCSTPRPEESSGSPSGSTCEMCGSPSVSGVASCPLCIPASRWVCLTDTCIGVNEGADTVCRQCGTAPLLTVNDEVLQWSSTSANLSGMAVTLRSARPSCSSCGHEVSAAAFVCPQCSASQPPSTRIEAWIVLRALHDLCASSVECASSFPAVTSVAAILSAAKSLCNTPVDFLPWAGVDIETGYVCEASTSPVTWNGRRHFGIRTLSDILLSLVALISAQDRGSAVWCVLVGCCLDLVELSNRSTDFDEIGFEVLSKVCTTIRPEQAKHIDEDTRIQYLVNLKLSRKAITNGVICSTCLGPADACSCSLNTK